MVPHGADDRLHGREPEASDRTAARSRDDLADDASAPPRAQDVVVHEARIMKTPSGSGRRASPAHEPGARREGGGRRRRRTRGRRYARSRRRRACPARASRCRRGRGRRRCRACRGGARRARSSRCRRRGRARRGAPASPRSTCRCARSRRSRRRRGPRGRPHRPCCARPRCRAEAGSRCAVRDADAAGRKRATSAGERWTQCAHRTSPSSQPTRSRY